MNEIGRNCLQLMQDPYGNYVVQYVLERCSSEDVRPVTSCPLGRIAGLSTQKFSSNVIEKCLEKGKKIMGILVIIIVVIPSYEMKDWAAIRIPYIYMFIYDI